MKINDPMSLRATATGATSWSMTKDGRNLIGGSGSGNTATFTEASVKSSAAGTYQVTFTNSVGSTAGTAATITVSP